MSNEKESMKVIRSYTVDELEKELERRKKKQERIARKGKRPTCPRKPKKPGAKPHEIFHEEEEVFSCCDTWQRIDISELGVPVGWDAKDTNYVVYVEGISGDYGGCYGDELTIDLTICAVRDRPNLHYDEQLKEWQAYNDVYEKKLLEYGVRYKQYKKDLAEWNKR